MDFKMKDMAMVVDAINPIMYTIVKKRFFNCYKTINKKGNDRLIKGNFSCFIKFSVWEFLVRVFKAKAFSWPWSSTQSTPLCTQFSKSVFFT